MNAAPSMAEGFEESKTVSVPSFVEHEKKIHTTQDLNNWVRSQAYYDVVAYINNTSVAIQGQRVRGPYTITEQMQKLCNIFTRLEHLVNENLPPGWQLKNLRTQMPPAQSTRQSCIRSYRAWMRHMYHNVFFLLDKALNPKCQFLHELGYYFSQSFGSPTCLDFGPGNELMFIFFLCALFRAGILVADDTIAAALMLYERYTQLVRRLIVTYMLPTSATRKHFNLVDYYALEYIWGAAQLSIDGPFDPISSENADIVKEYRDDYMLISSIDFLQRHRGRLREQAYQLWCILSLPNWKDVYDGVLHSYIKEVLGSFATVSNCVFSELMSFDSMPTGTMIARAILGKKPQAKQPATKAAKEAGASPDGAAAAAADAAPEDQQLEEELKPPVELYMAPKIEHLYAYDNQTAGSVDYTNDYHIHPFCMPRGDMAMHSTIEMHSGGGVGGGGGTMTSPPILDTATRGGVISTARITSTAVVKEVTSSALQFGDRLSIESSVEESSESTEDTSAASGNSGDSSSM